MPQTGPMLQARTLPPLATAGLALAGLGLIGMTAAELPGIPERFGIPPWALGALGGALATSALMPWLSNTIVARMREARTVIVAGAMLGALLVALGDVAGVVGGDPVFGEVASAINTGGRVLFGIGTGVVLGWVAAEASGSRMP